MAWKPKTVIGKIVKGAVIAGGSVLGLAGGTKILSAGVGAVSGIVKGTGALAGINKSAVSLKTTTNSLKESAIKLVTGSTKEERALINEQKDKTRAAAAKLELVDKLINAGATPEEARAKAGLSSVELTSIDGEPIQGGLFNNPVIKWGVILVGGFMLAKALKIIR